MRSTNKLFKCRRSCASSNQQKCHQLHPLSPQPAATSLSPLILLSIFPLLMILLSGVSCVVVYQLRFIVTKNGRTDYALAGESIELSCHYIMKDEDEDVKQLIWSKDGENFLRWRKNKPGLEVLSYTFKGHIDAASTFSHITIHNVTIDMHGKYKCSVKTDLGENYIEQDLVVISQLNCKLNDWRVTSQPTQCRESFRLDCKNMFPKPVPSCGLWNGKLDKFIRSVMVDISEEPNKKTYRIKYSDKFELQQPNNGSQINPMNLDLLQYAGHLIFKCDIIVPETSWKLSLTHRMFDYNDGCYQDPLDTIERMRLNYSQYATSRMQQAGYLMEKQLDEYEMLTSNLKYEILPQKSSKSSKVELNCWQKPRIGSLARLTCATKSNQVKLIGANLLECRSIGWVPIPVPVLSSNQNPKKPYRGRRPPRPSRRVPLIPETYVDLEPQSNNQEEEISTEFSISPRGSNDLEEPSSTNTISSTEVEIIPTTPQQILNIEYQSNDIQGSTLTPAQLAALLPTCISTKRNQPNTISSNRLPLLDEVRILGSSSSSSNPNNKHPTNQDGPQQNSIFNFSSSGSKATFNYLNHKSSAFNLIMVILSIGCMFTL